MYIRVNMYHIYIYIPYREIDTEKKNSQDFWRKSRAIKMQTRFHIKINIKSIWHKTLCFVFFQCSFSQCLSQNSQLIILLHYDLPSTQNLKQWNIKQKYKVRNKNIIWNTKYKTTLNWKECTSTQFALL